MDGSYENSYKIVKIIGSNLNKMNPNYFSKICGTTGLIVFFIKDALDFIGITFEKNPNMFKCVTTSLGIIEVVNEKIKHLKKYQNKIYEQN
jgi:hypothetical protein